MIANRCVATWRRFLRELLCSFLIKRWSTKYKKECRLVYFQSIYERTEFSGKIFVT